MPYNMAQKEQISTPVHESHNGISFLMAGAGGGGSPHSMLKLSDNSTSVQLASQLFYILFIPR